jgi:hypothetical protein
MPCRTEPSFEELQTHAIQGFLGELSEKGVKISKERYPSPDYLCSLMKTIDAKTCSLELQIWWRDHIKEDAKNK